MIILPRQARDRHREGTPKQRERGVFCAGARDAIVRETITELVEKATRPTTTGVGGDLMSMSSADAIEAEAGSTGGGGGGGGEGAASVALYRSLSQQYLEALQGEGLLEPLHVALALPLCDSVEAVERAATTIARTRSSGNDAVRPHAATHATTQPRNHTSVCTQASDRFWMGVHPCVHTTTTVSTRRGRGRSRANTHSVSHISCTIPSCVPLLHRTVALPLLLSLLLGACVRMCLRVSRCIYIYIRT
jgi:hypothetical protein